MKSRNFFVSSILLIVLFTAPQLTGGYALAQVTEPNFPSCEDPEGEVISSYSSGTHGVPGDFNTYNGIDTVFKLSSSTLTQCLCPLNSETGIQTNWWKIQDLTGEEIESLQKEGWVFVPNGTEWGLEEDQYLAKNSEFACFGRGGNEEDEDEDKSSKDKNDKHDAPRARGGILGNVLSLASTGNAIVIYFLIFVGALSFYLSLFLANKKQ